TARFEEGLRARGQQAKYIRALEAKVSSADGPAQAAKSLAELAAFGARVGGDPELHARLRAHASKIRRDLEAVGYAEPEGWRALERVYADLGDDAATSALRTRVTSVPPKK